MPSLSEAPSGGGMYGTTTWVTKKYLYIGNTFIDTYPFFASLA